MRRLHNVVYKNSEITAEIDENVHSERDRNILKDRYVDGLTFEAIAEKRDVSPKTVKNVIYRHEKIILKFQTTPG